MSWRLNIDHKVSGRGRFRWDGPLPAGTVDRDYDDGWVTDWIAFPRPSPEAIEAARKRIAAEYRAWTRQEDEKKHARMEAMYEGGKLGGDPRRDVTTIPPRTCDCCGAVIRFGDARFHSLLQDGVCSNCWLYLNGKADAVRVSRIPTVEEVLLLPVDQLSGDALTLLYLLRQHREGSP